MRHKGEPSPVPYLRIILTIFFSAAALLGGAYLLGQWLGGDVERIVREPGEIYDPIEPYIPGTEAAAAAGDVRQESGSEGSAGTANSINSDSTGRDAGTDGTAGGDLAGGVRWPALDEERRARLSGQTVGWGQGVEVNDQNQPTGALYGRDKYGELGGYFILPDAGNTVYLTYDLGYENGYTAPILDALKEKDIKGVFFVTMDYVKSAPELVRRIIDEGHVLGNHSVHHPSMPACSAEEAEQEIMGLHNYVKETFGYEMTLFRFPRGEFSEKTLVQARDLGYASVFWSYAYVDWKTDAQPEVSASLTKLTKAAHPGAIYLLHTVSATNAALMGDLIDNLQAAGYTIGLLPH